MHPGAAVRGNGHVRRRACTPALRCEETAKFVANIGPRDANEEAWLLGPSPERLHEGFVRAEARTRCLWPPGTSLASRPLVGERNQMPASPGAVTEAAGRAVGRVAGDPVGPVASRGTAPGARNQRLISLLPRRQRGVEQGRPTRHTSTIRVVGWHHEDTTHRARHPPKPFAGHLRRKPTLLIELAQRRLRRSDLGLDLDDKQRARGGVPGQ